MGLQLAKEQWDAFEPDRLELGDPYPIYSPPYTFSPLINRPYM